MSWVWQLYQTENLCIAFDIYCYKTVLRDLLLVQEARKRFDKASITYDQVRPLFEILSNFVASTWCHLHASQEKLVMLSIPLIELYIFM